ncbi:radical SAM protein [Ruminococcus sp.]|uniref:radical SAM protein n=1 Tax=Ruminococcus sp. TaxID=41978 RepID=UPI001B43E1B9|nr:radical SAM protein [Ruminococcus sp.]MBP5432088.1 radical SAM protein [Ruminococcus sp.]
MNRYLKNLDRIEFVVTMGCTGRCKHCSEGSHVFAGEHIDGETAAKAVTEVCRHYDIKSLMTFGGEPLLFPEAVCSIHRAAAEASIKHRDVITNGFFSTDRQRIREVAEMLAKSGVNRIMLSVDAFHQETIPLEPVDHFAECVREAGVFIELHPAWLVSAEDRNPYNSKTTELIGFFAEKGFSADSGNVIFPKGSALKYLLEYFDGNTVQSDPYEEDPEDIRSLCFEADGSVLGGNIYSSDIMDIIEVYTAVK